MTGIVLMGVGLLLCFAGVASLRLAVAAAGFGVTWLLADALGAAASAALLLALAGGLAALVLGLVLSRLLLILVSGLAGAVIAAKTLVILDPGRVGVLLALVVVPSAALVFVVMAHLLRGRFVLWATAFGGASVALSGLGRLTPETLGAMHDPEGLVGQLVVTAAWIALAVVGGLTQQRVAARQ
jgi:hypothetical protein